MDLRETHQMTREQEYAHWWIRTRFGYLAEALDVAQAELKKPLRILEVGCGTGQNLEFIRTEYGSRAQIESLTGIDPHFAEKPILRGGTTADWIGRTLDEAPYAGPFDVIIAMDVLEHIENDGQALQEWLDRLTPNGFIFLTVPALPSLWSQHDVRLAHFRRYTEKTLRAVIESIGAEVLRIRYAFFYVTPLVFLVRKLGLGARTGSDLMPVPKLANTVLRALGSAERKAGGNPWLGTSLVALVRKSSS